MSQQQSTSRTSVALATAFVVVSFAAFAVSFYFLDGQTVIAPLYATVSDVWSNLIAGGPEPVTNDPVQTDKLVLPAEMPEEFALRLWQEQVDSQAIIGRLVRNEVSSMTIDRVVRSSDAAVLKVTVTLRDKTKGPGEIWLRKLGSDWYMAFANGLRSPDATGLATAVRPSTWGDETTTPLPDKDKVDPQLLNTLLVEHQKSQGVIDEYLSGIVKEIVVKDVIEGPDTATVTLRMNETHGTADAKIVAIRSEKSGEPVWFVARFTKTASDHPDVK